MKNHEIGLGNEDALESNAHLVQIVGGGVVGVKARGKIHSMVLQSQGREVPVCELELMQVGALLVIIKGFEAKASLSN